MGTPAALLIVAAIFGSVGIVFLCVGLGIGSNAKKKRQRCTYAVDATVKENIRCRSGSSMHGHSRSSYYAPVLEFTYNGTEMTYTKNSGTNPPEFSPGEHVKLMIDPEKPSCCYIEGSKVSTVLTIVFTAAGAFLVLLAVVFAAFIIVTASAH